MSTFYSFLVNSAGLGLSSRAVVGALCALWLRGRCSSGFVSLRHHESCTGACPIVSEEMLQNMGTEKPFTINLLRLLYP